MFIGNVNAIALGRLLAEPRVLLILVQAIMRTGLTANNLTRFPVNVQRFSIQLVGGATMCAYLVDLVLFPHIDI